MLNEAQCLIFLVRHDGFGLGCLVGLAGKVQQAVRQDAQQFVVSSSAYLGGVGLNHIPRDEYITVDAMRRGVVERDDIRIEIMVQKLTVHRQFFLVGAEDIGQFAYSKAVARRYFLQPSAKHRLLLFDERYALFAERTIMDEMNHFIFFMSS